MNNNKSTNPIILAFLFNLLLMACLFGTSISADEIGKQEVNKEAKQQDNPYANAAISIRIIPSVKNTFGYDILLRGKPLVHQPHIPGLPGQEGFSTKERAQTVAEFVVKKIRKNEMPPTVSIEDLHKMGVLKED
jgi:hypothetical protein